MTFNILLTGVTGSIAQLTLFMILRDIEDLGHVYCLIRNKKGSSAKQRLDKIVQTFNSWLEQSLVENKPGENISNGRLKERLARINEYVSAINGDITKSKLGISDTDMQIFTNEQNNVNCIINSAAAISFTLPIQQAVANNCTGVKEILELMKTYPSIRTFKQISTCYVFSYSDASEPDSPCGAVEAPFHILSKYKNKTIDELYELGLTGQLELDTKKYANTYCFTKSLSEQLIKYYKKTCLQNASIEILRPSIVSGSIACPYPGWVSNTAALTGFLTAIKLNLVNDVMITPQATCDMIPVDDVARQIVSSLQHSSTANDLNCGTCKLNYKNICGGIANSISYCYLNKIFHKDVVFYNNHNITEKIIFDSKNTLRSRGVSFASSVCANSPFNKLACTLKKIKILNSEISELAYFSSRTFNFLPTLEPLEYDRVKYFKRYLTQSIQYVKKFDIYDNKLLDWSDLIIQNFSRYNLIVYRFPVYSNALLNDFKRCIAKTDLPQITVTEEEIYPGSVSLFNCKNRHECVAILNNHKYIDFANKSVYVINVDIKNTAEGHNKYTLTQGNCNNIEGEYTSTNKSFLVNKTLNDRTLGSNTLVNNTFVSQRNVLITGASGFLGHHIIRQLLERLLSCQRANLSMTLLINKNDVNMSKFPHYNKLHDDGKINVKQIQIGTRNVQDIVHESFDVIYHLAGKINHSRDQDDSIFKINRDMTLDMIQLCHTTQSKRIICASTSGIIACSDNPLKFSNESDDAKNMIRNWPYYQSKREAYEQGIELAKQFEIQDRLVFFCPSTLLGPGDHVGHSTKHIKNLYRNKQWISTNCTMDFCDVRDVARAVVNIGTHTNPKQTYLMGGNTLTNKEFFAITSKLLSKHHNIHRINPINIPTQIVDSITSLSKFTGYDPVVIEMASKHWQVDPSLVNKELDYAHYSMLNTLSDTIQYIVDTEPISREVEEAIVQRKKNSRTLFRSLCTGLMVLYGIYLVLSIPDTYSNIIERHSSSNYSFSLYVFAYLMFDMYLMVLVGDIRPEMFVHHTICAVIMLFNIFTGNMNDLFYIIFAIMELLTAVRIISIMGVNDNILNTVRYNLTKYVRIPFLVIGIMLLLYLDNDIISNNAKCLWLTLCLIILAIDFYCCQKYVTLLDVSKQTQ